ncbi:MAG: ribonuclease H [Acidobacteriota bacterium]
MSFTCDSCGSTFDLPPAVQSKYPNWVPKQCMSCRDGKGGGSSGRRKKARGGRRATPTRPPTGGTVDERLRSVVERYHEGPQSGLFTDGGASPNPGPGGWGLVWVEDGVVREQLRGGEHDSTNNRMELQALIEAAKLLDEDASITVYSDSQLCVKTINEWADGWARRGWKRKSGPIKNLELVQELHALCKARPDVSLSWVPGHSGWTWNEYADVLATAGREELR